MRFFTFACSALISFFAGVLISDSEQIEKKEYQINSSRIKNDLKILYLTDLHSKQFGKDNIRLINKINSINPDIILIGGDFVVSKTVFSTEPMYKLLEKVAKQYPVYFSLGNHEARLQWDPDMYDISYDDLLQRLTDIGVKVLDNDSYYISEYGVTLYGLNLPHEYYKKSINKILDIDELNQILEVKEDKTFKILLAHNPVYADTYCKTPANLVLSGHMHGGVTRLPAGYGLIDPRFKLFIKNCHGAFKKNGTINIISAGLAMHTIPVRIFNPSQLVEINIKRY